MERVIMKILYHTNNLAISNMFTQRLFPAHLLDHGLVYDITVTHIRQQSL